MLGSPRLWGAACAALTYPEGIHKNKLKIRPMKRRRTKKRSSLKIFALTAIFAAGAFAISNYFLNKSYDLVVAKVNGDKIYKSEIETKLHFVFDGQDQAMKIPAVEDLPQEVIEILAKEIYFDSRLTSEAKKSKSTQNPEVQGKITEATNRILRQAYIDSILKSEITEEAISAKYSELSSEISGKKEYSVSHILVKDKKTAEKLEKELKKSPNNFSKLAKEYSIDQETAQNGGNLGFVVEGNIIQEIADVLSKLKKDQISDPIQTKFGWHLIKLNDTRDAKMPSFEAVKETIRNELVQEKISEINSRITDNIKIELLIKPKETDAKPVDNSSSDTEETSQEDAEK